MKLNTNLAPSAPPSASAVSAVVEMEMASVGQNIIIIILIIIMIIKIIITLTVIRILLIIVIIKRNVQGNMHSELRNDPLPENARCREHLIHAEPKHALERWP